MVKELFDKTFGTVVPHARYEEVKDSPGENLQIRVNLPFYNLETEENIVLSVVFDQEQKLFQISDLGFCCSKLDNIDRESLNSNRNFVRANGFLFDYSKENNFFFVLSPPVEYEENEKVNIPALIAHYVTVVLSYNR